MIHNGKTSADTVGVLIEVKRPSNKNEMITPDRPNTKAMHELLHYYMQERYIRNNTEIKHVIICNIYEWYIFDAVDFERFFFTNQKLVKSYKDWNEGMLVGTNTDWFYQVIAKDFIEKNLVQIPCTCFDLKDFVRIARNPDKTDDKKLINLYKILSPAHLLKQPFANDSNSPNKEFYSELLHILGLEEIKEKGKKLIQRKPAETRHEGSLLENTINILKVKKKTADDKVFSVALELCITWLNRLLFLKLLEGQLITYHHGNRDFAFLNCNRIGDFDELDELFFEVLAVRIAERNNSVGKKFGNIPYLNSSLFEESELEQKNIHISNLKGRLTIPYSGSTVLKKGNGKRCTGEKSTLHYLFDFLDAYDFATEGNAEIQEQNKSIINAAVLGLIFEKINGYKDGSFFTPGFITMYMCRVTIRRAAVQKFNERYDWQCPDYEALYNHIGQISIKEANAVINSLKICDVAVGSGHFLVSALNEIIWIKSDLGILVDKDGRKLRDYSVTIENDELIVVSDEQVFEYNFKNAESQRVQETLFHEKETIIENCLFGVDINHKSVMICRLRLWVELLKNAYYRPEEGGVRQLETLPNIDINIKCGNSLVSRFALSGKPKLAAVSRRALKDLTDRYRKLVLEYKQSPSDKAQLRKSIEELKHDLESYAQPNDKEMMNLWLKKEELSQLSLFAYNKEEAVKRQKLYNLVEELERRFKEKEKLVYSNAFEWRLEFPEVLNENGDFVGFDAVIGNPPYIRQEAIKDQKIALKEMFGSFFCGTADLYTYFYKVGINVLKTNGSLCFIAPNKFMRTGYGRNTRELLTTQAKPLMVLGFGELPVFEEATIYPSIVQVEKLPLLTSENKKLRTFKKEAIKEVESTLFAATFTDPDQLAHFDEMLPSIGLTIPVSALSSEGWTLELPEVLNLIKKLKNKSKSLSEHVAGGLYYGIKTGRNAAFEIDKDTCQRLINEHPSSQELIRPWLRGKDIFKWKAKWAGLYVIFTRRGTDIEKFPAIKRHLEQFREDLEPKPTIKKKLGRDVAEAEHERKRGRKPGSYKWFEIQDNIAYFEEFDKTKILWPGLSADPSVFCLDEEGFLGNDNNQLIIPGDYFLLAVLNSKPINFMLKHICDKVRGGFYRMKMIYIAQLPIPTATDTQKAQIAGCIEKILGEPNSPNVPQLEAEIERLVYYGTGSGVYKTSDGGMSWSKSLVNVYVYTLAIDPVVPTTIYAGTLGNGIFMR